MPYCTISDITDQLPSRDLIALTDDDRKGVANSAVVDRAIADGDATIDAYCQNRYPLPLDPVPTAIRRLCVDLAIYNLFSRRSSVLDLPEIRKDRQKEAIRFLEKVATGTIQIGAALPEPETSGNSVSISSPERVFSRDTLANY